MPLKRLLTETWNKYMPKDIKEKGWVCTDAAQPFTEAGRVQLFNLA
jgi:hypothetical protein